MTRVSSRSYDMSVFMSSARVFLEIDLLISSDSPKELQWGIKALETTVILVTFNHAALTCFHDPLCHYCRGISHTRIWDETYMWGLVRHSSWWKWCWYVMQLWLSTKSFPLTSLVSLTLGTLILLIRLIRLIRLTRLTPPTHPTRLPSARRLNLTMSAAKVNYYMSGGSLMYNAYCNRGFWLLF
jgi:hypothetical protein